MLVGRASLSGYQLIKLSRGKVREVHPLLYVTAPLFALAFVWPALQGLVS